MDQLENDLSDRREEYNSLEVYIQELRDECQTEKKTLNSIQIEQQRQRKTYDDLRVKSKTCQRLIQGADNEMDRLQTDLKAKSSYIEELENCLMDKNRELNLLNQAFQKNQEETRQFKKQLSELEEATRNNAQTENDLQQFLNNNFDAESDYLVDTKPPFQAQPPSTKTMLNQLLITPSLRKAYSSNLVGLLETPIAVSKENHLQLNDPATKLVAPDKLQERTNRLLGEQETYKHELLMRCSEKMANLDASKQQTRCSIDQLRANLQEIELMTANNIFKITGMRNCHA